MSVINSVYAGAGAGAAGSRSANRVNATKQQRDASPPDMSEGSAGSFNEQVLDVMESEGLNNTVTVGMGAYAFASGAGVPFAVGLAAGYLGAMAGSYLGDKAGNAFAGMLGWKKVATEGDLPARMGDVIAHQKKDLGGWGALGGILLGAAAAVFVMATFGTGLVVIAAAAATAGFIGGTLGAAGAAMGQYGENKGTIIAGSPDVFFEGKPVARVGDPVMCSDHPGPPPVIAEGAKTVYANGLQIARLGHRTTCDANINSAATTIVETQETAQVYAVKDSRSALLRWAVIVASYLPLPRNKKGATEEPTVSTQSKSCSSAKCTKPGEPVDVATGDYFQEWSVIDIPGILPLRLGRLYRSRADVSGIFGGKWADDWSQQLIIEKSVIHFRNHEGVVLTYDVPEARNKVKAVNLHEGQYLLYGQRRDTLHIFNRQTQQILSFDPQPGHVRRLSQVRDRFGNQIRFIYSDELPLQLCRIEHSDGYALDLSYEDQKLVSVELITATMRQRLMSCRYDEQGYLAECDSHQFSHLFHEYTAEGYMTRWRDTDKTDAHIQYDPLGRVVGTRTASGHFADRFIYDDVTCCTAYIDAEGGETRFWYNTDGQVYRQVDPLGREHLTEWEFSNKLSETDALGRTVIFARNQSGEPEQVTLPDGSVWNYRWNGFGQLTERTSPLGQGWRFIYGKQGQLRTVTDPQGRRREHRYSPQGELLRDISADGMEWRYSYNAQHQLCEVTAPDGGVTSLVPDGLSRPVEVVDPLNQTTRYVYSPAHASPAGSISEIHLPDGVKQQYAYDSEKRLTVVTDGEGKSTRYEYGAFDILNAMTRPDGQRLTFDYDRLTRLTQVTNALGNTYSYTRDRAGQVIAETDFTGRTLRYQYDAAGRCILTRYPDNRVVRWHYSVRDEVVRRETWQCGETCSGLVATVSYDYDPAGRLVRAENADAVVEFDYDEAGQLTAERLNGREIRHQWDSLKGTPAGRQFDKLGMSFVFGAQHELKEWQLEGHQPLLMHHDRLGRETLRESGAGFVQGSQYTATGLLANLAAGRDSVLFRQQLMAPEGPLQASGINRSWEYDRAYNVVGIDDGRWGKTQYQYDANDQIVRAHFGGLLPQEERFSYDGAQNLCSHQRLGAGIYAAWEENTQQQRAGRVVRCGHCRYRYDEAGRLAEKREEREGYRERVWRYRWNTESQLSELMTPEGERWAYRYDALGRRIRKQRLSGGHPGARPVGYDYLWSGDQLTEEVPLYADGTQAYDESVHWLYTPGALTPLARYEKGQLHYVVSDHMGTPRELLTEQGNVAWSGRLNTWGGIKLWQVAANDGDKLRCNLRFAGQYADEESGLHYNRYRYYDSETGQYLTPDPIGLLGGVNPYGYVHNPLSWVDPLGLASYPPVTETTTASNGLDYRSNPKHTLGGVGNSLKAGIEPRNSLDLFGDSVLGKNGNRYALDSDGSLHRFADSNDGSWHWNGSTGQSSPRPNLTSKQAGNDILNKFGLPKKGW